VTCDLLSLATPGVRGLRPYEPGMPMDALERELGISDIVKLASNESPIGPSPRAVEAVGAALGELSRYPDGNGYALKTALAEIHDVPRERITLGNGSNDILELLARVFVGAGDEVVFSEHAFAVYPIATQAVGGVPVVVPAVAHGHDLDGFARAVTDRTRLVFVANPNNPTGTWVGAADLEALLGLVPENVIVVVDEAYAEYVDVQGYASLLRATGRYPNLVVTRTFSKAYGLAALRVGFGVSDPQVADLLNRVRMPFNVNSAALVAAVAALGDRAHLGRAVEVNRSGMRALTAAFDSRGLEHVPSVANFVSVRLPRPAAQIYDALLHLGVIVRPIAGYGMPEHLRVTVGLPEENARFLAALDEALR
jgi:histidinol-phosphate aminotransferase